LVDRKRRYSRLLTLSLDHHDIPVSLWYSFSSVTGQLFTAWGTLSCSHCITSVCGKLFYHCWKIIKICVAVSKEENILGGLVQLLHALYREVLGHVLVGSLHGLTGSWSSCVVCSRTILAAVSILTPDVESSFGYPSTAPRLTVV